MPEGSSFSENWWEGSGDGKEYFDRNRDAYSDSLTGGPGCPEYPFGFIFINAVKVIEGKTEDDPILILGSSGRIEGNIRVKDAHINGTVIENVYASGLIDLNQDAKIEGSIEYNEIKKHENAIITGSSNKIN